MAQATQKASEFALEEFLLYLKEQGFPCGVGERVKAMRLYAATVADRESRLKTILCPVFARSEADQERFYQAWDLFWATSAPTEAPPAPAGETPLDIPVDTPLWQPDPPKWRPAAKIALIVLIAIGAIVYFEVPQGLRTAMTKPGPPPPPAQVQEPNRSYRQVTENRDVPFERGCNGLECVTQGWRPWTLFGLVIAFALLQGASQTSTWRQFVLRRREGGRLAPFHWPVFRHSPRLTVYQGLLMRCADAMRMRLASDVDELDIAGTINATIQRAGFPAFCFRSRRRTPEYIFLVERRSDEDHMSHWWHDLARALQRLGVTLQVYFYSSDLRRCYAAGSAEVTSTAHLLDTLERHHVIVFGRGRDLLQGYSHFPSWMNASLVRRESKTLLTPSASFEWGAAENKVRAVLPVMPARIANLAALPQSAAGLSAPRRDDAEVGALQASYFEETEEMAHGEPPSLSLMLDEDVFQWLCACALYPRLEWHLTLHLGLVIDPTGRIFEEHKMLQLVRMPWFREGRMPGPWRAWLAKCIDDGKAAAARRVIVDALEHNLAPENSYARDQQRLQIAAQRYWLEPRNAHRCAELEAAMQRLPMVDVDEDYLLAQLRKTPRPQDAKSRSELAGARFRQSGWKFAAAFLGLLGMAVVGLSMVPVGDRRTETHTRYEEVATQNPAPAKSILLRMAKGGDAATLKALTEFLQPFGKATIDVREKLAAVISMRVRYSSADDAPLAQAISQKLKKLAGWDAPAVLGSDALADATRPIIVSLPANAKLPRLGDRALHEGDEGPDVRELQAELTKAGYSIAASGIFDEEVRRQLVNFQKASGLVADGIANANTFSRLRYGNTQEGILATAAYVDNDILFKVKFKKPLNALRELPNVELQYFPSRISLKAMLGPSDDPTNGQYETEITKLPDQRDTSFSLCVTSQVPQALCTTGNLPIRRKERTRIEAVGDTRLTGTFGRSVQLQVRVLDDKGQPVPRAPVVWGTAKSATAFDTSGGASGPFESKMADDKGISQTSVRLGSMETQYVEALVATINTQRVRFTIQVQPSPTQSSVSRQPLYGVLNDSAGKPLANATLLILEVATKTAARKVNLQTTTNENGVFNLPNVLDIDSAWATFTVALQGEKLDSTVTKTDPVALKWSPFTWDAKPKNVLTYPGIINRIEALERVPFDGSSSTPVMPNARISAAADMIRALLGDFRGEITVEGHAGGRGADPKTTASQQEPLNVKLSQQRAEAVRDVLVKLGIPANRLRAVGYGSTRPRCQEETALCYAENQRVEFSIIQPASAK